MKIYTGKGDAGHTGLAGGEKLLKSDERIEAYGSVDELNSMLGLARAQCRSEGMADLILEIQKDLLVIGSMLASMSEGSPTDERLHIKEERVRFLEEAIDAYEKNLPSLTHFIIPGGDRNASILHMARAVCRRVERRVVARGGDIGEHTIPYLNRLSDLLFVLARSANMDAGVEDIVWEV